MKKKRMKKRLADQQSIVLEVSVGNGQETEVRRSALDVCANSQQEFKGIEESVPILDGLWPSEKIFLGAVSFGHCCLSLQLLFLVQTCSSEPPARFQDQALDQCCTLISPLLWLPSWAWVLLGFLLSQHSDVPVHPLACGAVRQSIRPTCVSHCFLCILFLEQPVTQQLQCMFR